jgi:hypothetical protein
MSGTSPVSIILTLDEILGYKLTIDNNENFVTLPLYLILRLLLADLSDG